MDSKQLAGISMSIFLILFLVTGIAAIYIALTPDENDAVNAFCGNKVIEAGEAPASCCIDAGCLSGQECINNTCIPLKCGYCENAIDKKCQKMECCSNAECLTSEYCSGNKCIGIECECGIIKDHVCSRYECCNNEECDSGICENNRCLLGQEITDTENVKTIPASKTESDNIPSPAPASLTQQQPAPVTVPQQVQVPPECTYGQVRNCGNSEVGECAFGTQSCQSGNKWGVCHGEVTAVSEICDGKDNDCNGVIDNGNLCSSGQSCIAGSCQAVYSEYKVQPVIFFASDYPVDQAMVTYLKGKFEELRQFYLKKTGTTFTMLEPAVISGNSNHEWYWCVDNQQGCIRNNFEANIIAEFQAKGLPVHPDWNKYPSNRITWVIAFGAGGYAGGRQYPNGGGFAMVGDAGIYAAKDNNCNRVLERYFTTDNHPNIVDSCMNSWITSGKQYGFGIGAAGHELGHAFGLPHPDGYPDTTSQDWEKTIMGNHWNYPDTGFLQQDRDILATSKFFNSQS